MNKQPFEQFYTQFKILRGNRTQQEVADKAGCTRPELSNIEQGKGNITVKKFICLLRVLCGRQFKILAEYRDKDGNNQVMLLYIDTTNPERLKTIIERKREQHAPIKIHKQEVEQ